MKAIVFGEIIWDVYPDEKVIGGAPFNFSAHLSHLGSEAHLISAVGEDELGRDAMSAIQKHGICDDLMQTVPYPTGCCLVTLNEQKIPSYNVLENVAYDHIPVSDTLLNRIDGIDADVFYFNTLIQRHEASRATLKTVLEAHAFPELFCDVNLRPNCFDRESLLLCLENVTILKISDEESHFLTDMGLISAELAKKSIPEAIAEAFPNIKLVVYTLGKDGSEVYDTKAKKLYSSGKPEAVQVVSTVGAGDCFGATFLHHYLTGTSIPEAICQATARSNIVVSHREAVPF